MVEGITIVIGTGLVLLVVVIVGFIVNMYNGLVRLKNNLEKAWSNIDVLLKQRNDELSSLIDTVKEYMGYEKEVLQNVTEARTDVQKASGPKENAEANSMMEQALGNLFAVAEDYPDLKANQNFKQLQNRISTLEEQIADRREFYNDSVNTYNIRINQIPYMFLANLMGYEEKELFEATEEERSNVDVGSRFGN